MNDDKGQKQANRDRKRSHFSCFKSISKISNLLENKIKHIVQRNNP